MTTFTLFQQKPQWACNYTGDITPLHLSENKFAKKYAEWNSEDKSCQKGPTMKKGWHL